jgi:ferredoxin-NADP reductase
MYKYEVVKSEALTPSSLLLRLKPMNLKRRIKFYPGQYAAISFKSHGRPTPMRCFSIASSPNNNGEIEFAIRIQGDFTNTAIQLSPGDEVELMGPFGEFVIDEEIDENVILYAGGIGITPFMSMIRYATTIKLKIPIILLYSCQTQDDIPYLNELKDLERQNPYFKVAFFITSGELDKLKSTRVFSGRITEEFIDKITNNNYDSFTHFICGPTGFISAMQSTLINNDVSPDHLITEAFGQGVVTEKSHKQPSHETRLVYGMVASLLIVMTVFITGLDLVRAVPKISALQNPVTNSPANTTNTTSTNNTSSGSYSNTNSSTNNSNSGSSSSSTPQTQTVAPTPVTRIS